jgi:Domain of unknown function (DUF4134)
MIYFLPKPPGHYKPLALALTLISTFFSIFLHAQTADANTGLNQANTMIRSYYEPATNLMYAVAAILGLVGALQVFRRHLGSNSSDGASHVGVWFGACIFLAVVTTVIKAFFGI